MLKFEFHIGIIIVLAGFISQVQSQYHSEYDDDQQQYGEVTRPSLRVTDMFLDIFFDSDRRVTTQHILIFGITTLAIGVIGGIGTLLYFYGEAIENWLNKKKVSNCENCTDKFQEQNQKFEKDLTYQEKWQLKQRFRKYIDNKLVSFAEKLHHD